MLGDILYEETGQTSGIRVLSSEAGETEVEISLQTQGTIRGVAEHSLWTYRSKTRADGTICGTGTGFMTTSEGDVIHLIGHGAAKSAAPDGSISYRGSVLCQTTSEKFASLNGAVGVFEYDVAGDGSTSAKVWEWK